MVTKIVKLIHNNYKIQITEHFSCLYSAIAIGDEYVLLTNNSTYTTFNDAVNSIKDIIDKVYGKSKLIYQQD